MTPQHKPKRRPLADINVVPYIDVMLVLLVIFMITAPMMQQGVPVNLPSAHSQALPKTPDSPLIITIDASGQYAIRDTTSQRQHLSAQQLLVQVIARMRRAQSQHHALPVYVKGDQAARYGDVVRAMAMLQHAGIDHVALMTQQP